ncbi:aldose 1-epimerase, partial [mine drainage metagenome]
WTLASNKPDALLNYQHKFFPDGTSKTLDPFQLSSEDSMPLDNAFMSTGDIFFISGKRRLVIDRKGLDYLVLYNGVYSSGVSLAIEPMSAPPDAFNNGIGLITLIPGATTRASFRVTLKDQSEK